MQHAHLYLPQLTFLLIFLMVKLNHNSPVHFNEVYKDLRVAGEKSFPTSQHNIIPLDVVKRKHLALSVYVCVALWSYSTSTLCDRGVTFSSH